MRADPPVVQLRRDHERDGQAQCYAARPWLEATLGGATGATLLLDDPNARVQSWADAPTAVGDQAPEGQTDDPMGIVGPPTATADPSRSQALPRLHNPGGSGDAPQAQPCEGVDNGEEQG